MENKYYTPTIEEFHVGFEFEKKEIIKSGISYPKKPIELTDIKILWNKTIFQKSLIENTWNVMDYSLKEIGEFIKLEEIRVKYLDREDMESLGWEYSSKSNVNNFVFDKLPYRINVNFATDKNLPKLSIYNYDGENVNRIIIRNKSELKKLMQMLNIETK